MTNRPRIFADWRFLAMLAFLLMVGYLVLTGVVAIQQNAEKGRQIDALIQQVNEQQDRADSERAAASAEQERLRANQRRILDLYSDLAQRQYALVTYLRSHRIKVPEGLTVTVVKRVTIKRPGGGGVGEPPPAPPPSSGPHGHGKGHGKGARK